MRIQLANAPFLTADKPLLKKHLALTIIDYLKKSLSI